MFNIFFQKNLILFNLPQLFLGTNSIKKQGKQGKQGKQ